MRIIADTNVLVRFITNDDERQAALAAEELRDAEVVAVPTAALCELVWVLRSVYQAPPRQIASALRTLLAAGNIRHDAVAAEVGLSVLEAGGDFADGAIAASGLALGGSVFLTFDRDAAALAADAGIATRVPGQ